MSVLEIALLVPAVVFATVVLIAGIAHIGIAIVNVGLRGYHHHKLLTKYRNERR